MEGKELLQHKINYVVMTTWLLLFTLAIVKLINKCKEDLLPTHIFELNVVFDMYLTGIFCDHGLGVFEKYFAEQSEWSPYCLMINILNQIFVLSLNGSIIVCQIDRFLQLYLNLAYSDIVDITKAVFGCVAQKALTIVLVTIGVYLEPNVLKCSTFEDWKYPPVCNALKSNNLYWITLPRSVMILVTLIVTIYVIKVVIHQQNQISPVVPIAPAVQQNEEDSSSVRRLNSNPTLFYRVPVPTVAVVGNLLPQSSTIENHLANTKRILNVNIQTMAVMLLFLPVNVFIVYSYVTGENCSSKPGMIHFLKASAIIEFLIFWALYVLIVWRRFQKLSSL